MATDATTAPKTGAGVSADVPPGFRGSTLAESSSVEGSLLAARVRVGRHARLAPGTTYTGIPAQRMGQRRSRQQPSSHV